MSSFKEFLQDYEAREVREIDRFTERFDKGETTQDEPYPSYNRFIKLREPIAYAGAKTNVWATIPFFGSTILKLIPRSNRIDFDSYHTDAYGFSSKNIDDVIDFIKDTGRMQFALSVSPTLYKDLEFLAPVFDELKPPVLVGDPVKFAGRDNYSKLKTEFYTLAGFGYLDYVRWYYQDRNRDESYINEVLENHRDRYVLLKALGYTELTDEIGDLMTFSGVEEAYNRMAIYGEFIVNPQTDLLKGVHILSRSQIESGRAFIKNSAIDISSKLGDVNEQLKVPYEIGKFVLNKTAYNPTTLDGCVQVMQKYDDLELNRVMRAFSDSVKHKNRDGILSSIESLNNTFESVWNDSDKIKDRSKNLKDRISLGFGICGEVASNIPGAGILAKIGFKVLEKSVENHGDAMCEGIIKKFTSPNYLVCVYDFKKTHKLE